MNKDYVTSKKYASVELDKLNIPYVMRDSCVDYYVPYLQCKMEHIGWKENRLFYKLPFAGVITSCANTHKTWEKCQDKREREIFEGMRQIYKDSFKQFS